MKGSLDYGKCYPFGSHHTSKEVSHDARNEKKIAEMPIRSKKLSSNFLEMHTFSVLSKYSKNVVSRFPNQKKGIF